VFTRRRKRDNSIRYVLSPGSVDAMVVGFEKLFEIDDFAARVKKVPKTRIWRSIIDHLIYLNRTPPHKIKFFSNSCHELTRKGTNYF